MELRRWSAKTRVAQTTCLACAPAYSSDRSYKPCKTEDHTRIRQGKIRCGKILLYGTTMLIQSVQPTCIWTNFQCSINVFPLVMRAWQMRCVAEHVNLTRRWCQARVEERRHARVTTRNINLVFKQKSEASLTHIEKGGRERERDSKI